MYISLNIEVPFHLRQTITWYNFNHVLMYLKLSCFISHFYYYWAIKPSLYRSIVIITNSFFIMGVLEVDSVGWRRTISALEDKDCDYPDQKTHAGSPTVSSI